MPTRGKGNPSHHYISIRMPAEHAALIAEAAAAKRVKFSSWIIDTAGAAAASELGKPAPAPQVTLRASEPPPAPDALETVVERAKARGLTAEDLLRTLAAALGDSAPPVRSMTPPSGTYRAVGGHTDRVASLPRGVTPAAYAAALRGGR